MKHFLKTKLLPLVIAFCFFLLPACNVIHVEAAETTDSLQHIYDDANLLSDSERSALEEKCISYGDDAGMNIFILTHNDADTPDGEIYIEDFFDQNLLGVYPDSIILLVDMSRRDVILEAYGDVQTYVHSKRGDKIIEKISPYLTDGEYYTAFEIYIESSAAYMEDKSDPNYSRNYTKAPELPEAYEDGYTDSSQENILHNIWLQLVAALAIGAITVSIMAYNAGGKMTVGGNTYLDQSRSGLIGRRDDYIRTTVTRVRKPQTNNNSNSSSGGFHGGVSAGGASHSTSRGKF